MNILIRAIKIKFYFQNYHRSTLIFCFLLYGFATDLIIRKNQRGNCNSMFLFIQKNRNVAVLQVKLLVYYYYISLLFNNATLLTHYLVHNVQNIYKTNRT